MTNGQSAAFNFDPTIFQKDSPLTKREYFAAMAMTTFDAPGKPESYQRVAANSVAMADALIAALNNAPDEKEKGEFSKSKEALSNDEF